MRIFALEKLILAEQPEMCVREKQRVRYLMSLNKIVEQGLGEKYKTY